MCGFSVFKLVRGCASRSFLEHCCQFGGPFAVQVAAAPDPEQLTSPVTPSRRSERVFPLSSVVNLPQMPGPGTNEPLKSNGSGRWTASTPTPYLEHSNPFDGDRLYVNFNEELDRQRQNRETLAA